ncbi:MAG TPA: excinuclease ABC subunit UvrB [Candidatus Atribacteria bacterium]|nr:excinuclease ABC subunit UvrB [Candidatus Atribacteria bacterium]
MEKNNFHLSSLYEPCGDQPQAIGQLVEGLQKGYRYQTLLGVTGSGKTFTMANVIAQSGLPTIIISHNKTLAAQLYSEMRAFFPDNAVEYFVSYYDYYQPEAYVSEYDLYIEKDASINQQLDRLRLKATSSLMERRDVVIVASVSCIYGIGSPREYEKRVLHLQAGQGWKRDDLVRRFVDLLYERNEIEFSPGYFRMKGDTVEIYPAYSETAVRLEFFGPELESIKVFEPVSGKTVERREEIFIYPAKHYLVDEGEFERALRGIEREMEERVNFFLSQGRLVEAERLRRRTKYDLELLRETGYCPGIENYSRHLDGRSPGEPPYTLLDYFPPDYLVIIDESHVTIPQLRGMQEGDRSRKESLVNFGFRLPSAFDNRPLTFEEFESKVKRCIFVSATPGPFELQHSDQIVEQLIRPTGLLDPQVEIRKARGQVEDLLGEIRKVVDKNQRVLVTTLTKKSAEDLCDFLYGMGVKVRYLHSEIDTLERAKIVRDLRRGEFDVLVGVNLLREGLDLPEVALVAVLDADKEGFLRSEVSLIQTMGRAARNVEGRVILYADEITGSIERAVKETRRRREVQEEYNQEHGIIPQSIVKEVRTLLPEEEGISKEAEEVVELVEGLEEKGETKEKWVERLTQEMLKAAQDLEFEKAAILRDEILKIKSGNRVIKETMKKLKAGNRV